MTKNIIKNNKGFSLVELIIVIAIMAILSAALAPQLMKYIEKSRASTDKTTCKAIESCLNTAFTNDGVWTDVSHNWHSNRPRIYLFIKRDEATDKLFFKGIATHGKFRKELEPMLTSLQNPKQVGKNSYKVVIDVKVNETYNDAGVLTDKTYSISGVSVNTSSYDVADDTQQIFTSDPEVKPGIN